MKLALVLSLVLVVIFVSFSDSKSTKKTSTKSKDHGVKSVKKSSTHLKESHHGKTKAASHTSKSKVTEDKTKIPKSKNSKKKVVSSKHSFPDNSHKKKSMKDKAKNTPKDKTKVKLDKQKLAKNDSKSSQENLKTIPHNCDEIVDQYSNGQLVMYEYKIEMARCLKGQQALKIDDSGNNYFTNALAQKYVDDDGQAAKDNDDKNDFDEYEDKKSVVPQTDVNTQTTPEQQDASYYPSQDQTNFDRSHDPDQNQAAFSQSPLDNMPAPVQQDYSYYTKSSIPAAPQSQDMTSQWHVPEAVDEAKKDTVPSAPLNNPFAQFMNDQASPDTTPQADQQRSDIPVQQYQLPAAQSYNTVPSNQQAYFIDQARAWSPEDNGLFPENP